MVCLRHTLALACVIAIAPALAGCFLFHEPAPDGEPDAGTTPAPIFDGGGAVCDTYPAFFHRMSCPASAPVGSSVEVTVDHAPGACCGSGAGSLRGRAVEPGSFEIDGTWTACECCESCRCVGPSSSATVTVGPIARGENVVFAGGVGCSVEGVDREGCDVVPAGAVAPRVLFEDQRFTTTLSMDETADCGCMPSIEATASSVDLLLCGCADFCDTVFATYLGNHREAGPRSLGEHSVTLGGEVRALSVVPRGSCRPLEARELSILGVEDRGARSGPRVVWAAIASGEALCCAEPQPAVSGEARPDGTIALTLYSCVREDCECVGFDTPFTAWHDLGELAPGTYRVEIDGLAQTFDVR